MLEFVRTLLTRYDCLPQWFPPSFICTHQNRICFPSNLERQWLILKFLLPLVNLSVGNDEKSRYCKLDNKGNVERVLFQVRILPSQRPVANWFGFLHCLCKSLFFFVILLKVAPSFVLTRVNDCVVIASLLSVLSWLISIPLHSFFLD